MRADRRDELRALLPWYENGTLRGAERQLLHDLLASDLEANRQRRELRVLRAALADEPILSTNMALGMGRLHDRLGFAAPPRRRVAPAWLAVAAVMIVAIGAGLFLAGENVGRYRTLSDPAPQTAVAADVDLIRVDVVAGVDAAALAALTGEPQARVLQGPSAHGVATLSVPHARADATLARLRADPRLRYAAVVPH
jgi:hypothetical protein